MSTPALRETHAVSAKLIAGEEADAIANVACADNDGVVVEDHGSYITLSGTGNIELRIDSIEEELGRPYDVPTLLAVLASYTGQVDVEDDRVYIREALST